MRRTAKVILAVGAAAVLGALVLLLVAFGWSREQKGTHLNRVDWLPQDARDVTYFKREGFGWITSYECTISKESLSRVAQERGWKMEPRKDVVTGLRRELGLAEVSKTEADDVDLVNNALFYEKRQPNGGGVTVVYDLNTSRLFVHESHM